jgi:4-alpha-glucanotransferase
LVASLRREGRLSKKSPGVSDVLAACLAYLAESPARVAIYNLEDFWGEELPQNVPGTGPERPNWRRRARLGLEDLKKNSSIRFLLNKIHKNLSDPPSE